MPSAVDSTQSSNLARYNRFLLLVAGLGGLLYGIDVGIIGGALPYLEATSGLSRSAISIIVAAVLLGSVFSTLFAGLLADWMGRKPLMLVSGAAFAISVPIIALSQSFAALFMGRLLQGVSGGLIGVVVPLYLAECLGAKTRGKGTGVFQWLLTLGIFAAALMGMFISYHVADIAKTGTPDAVFHAKDLAWRSIFWSSLPPGILFVITALFISESPRWLFRKGRVDAARTALLRSRMPEQAQTELDEMAQTAAEGKSASGVVQKKDSLFSRRYVIPFLLACVILSCNTATGINSVIGYNVDILIQSGLSDVMAHWGYVIFTFVNFFMTVVGMQLVDKKGRKFLFLTGTSGIIVAMLTVGTLFLRMEKGRYDARDTVQTLVAGDKLDLKFDADALQKLGAPAANGPQTLAVIYSYGDFSSSTTPVVAASDSAPISVSRESGIPETKVAAFFQNPFADLDAARTAPLKILHAYVTPVPSTSNGWLVAVFVYLFVGFYAMGPGVAVWLALSELMPTRIRSNGMSIALVLNQSVSTALAAIFLPVVGKYGYSTMFYLFAGFTVVYFLAVLFFLPETKGKTLEEIEKSFES